MWIDEDNYVVEYRKHGHTLGAGVVFLLVT